MLDYELAKQLKDAGFPQGPNVIFERVPTAATGNILDEPHASTPTLEELIEACGKPFGQLFQFDLDKAPEGRWGAVAQLPYWENLEGECLQANGSTPTEAVARLWLALHANGDASA